MIARGRILLVIAAVATASLTLAPAAPADLVGPLTPTVIPHPLLDPSSDPEGITAASDGTVWFTEGAGNQIGRLAPGGTVSEYPLPNPSSNPMAIAMGPDGNPWFTEAAGRIGTIAADGRVAEWATPGLAPQRLASGPDGNLWVTASGTSPSILRVAPDGSYTTFATGLLANAFAVANSKSAPSGIAVGPDGSLWFGDQGFNQIVRMRTDGTVTGRFGVPTAGAAVTGVAAGPDGNVWFAESAVGQIARVDSAGAVTEFALPATGNLVQSAPNTILAGSDGALWFTDRASNSVGRITTDGSAQEFPAGTAPVDLASSPSGNLWLTASGDGVVSAMTMPPLVTTSPATAQSPTTATLAGLAGGRDQETMTHFEYGPSAAYGASTPTQFVVAAPGAQPVSAPASDLQPNSTYHYRLVAQNGTGTVTGQDQTFSTPPPPAQDPTGPAWPAQAKRSGTAASVLGDVAPTVDVLTHGATVAADGRRPEVAIRVACPVSARRGCHGTVVITLAAAASSKSRHHRARRGHVRARMSRCARGCRPLGSGRLSAAPGKSQTVHVALNNDGRKLLRHARTLSVVVTVTTQEGSSFNATQDHLVLHAATPAGQHR